MRKLKVDLTGKQFGKLSVREMLPNCSVALFGGDEGYKRRQENDRIKRDYCKSNNIKLIEIPYTYSDNKIKETITNIIYP